MPPISQTLSFDDAHARIIALCEHFAARHAEVKAEAYKEATARIEFISPFFRALGWDVDNEAHRSIYEKDCVIEKAEQIAGSARSADYAFRRPGTHLIAFYVEAKKPAVDIRRHEECHQAVRYGWNANTPLVVLTDFEQLLILDSRAEPDAHHATRHILKANGSYTFRDYRDRDKFAELWGLFGREAVAAGSLEKAAAALSRLSGRILIEEFSAVGNAPVDATFLAQMELWRERLAKSLKRTNLDLASERLTALTQRILDRLVFLRFLEDRGIERDITFRQLTESSSAWEAFRKISHRLDARYNGIIYKKDPDGIEDPALAVDDAQFAGIVRALDPRTSKYLFATIPVTILGSIYERFLGNVIVARDRTAIVEPKPEVRKAGGVYYTPDYIVRYIVEESVGRCISGKTPAEIEKMRFADIACGSGSFLVEVFAALIRYHLRWYLDDKPQAWVKKGVLRRRETDGDLVLALREKRRILEACVFGIDLDPSAVEVTQLSLYLRLLEDESMPADQLLFDLGHRFLLPNLHDNILCGNSLIETDIADLFGLSNEEQEKLRPLDLRWQFPTVFGGGRGAFDVIVGNPPWGGTLTPVQRDYLQARFPSVADFESSQYFVLRAVTCSTRLGYIVPNTFALNVHARRCRKVLLEQASLRSIVDLSTLDVFLGPNVRSLILNAAKDIAASFNCDIYRLSGSEAQRELLREISQDHLKSSETWKPFLTREHPTDRILEKLALRGTPLSELCEVRQGYIPYRTTTLTRRHGAARAAQIVKGRLWHSTSRPRTGAQRELQGSDVERYKLNWSGVWVSYGEWVSTYLPLEIFSGPRLLVREITRPMPHALAATYCAETYVHNPSVLSVLPRTKAVHPHFLLGVLNSTLMSLIFQHFAPKADKGLFPKILITDAKRLIVPQIMPDSSMFRARHDRLVLLVGKMLIARQREKDGTGTSKDNLARQVAALDRQIDEVVYELYGLTRKEIELVEKSSDMRR